MIKFNIKNNYYFPLIAVVLIKNKKYFISFLCFFLVIFTFILYAMPIYIYPKYNVESQIKLNQIDSIKELFSDNKEIMNNMNFDISNLPNNFLKQKIIKEYLYTKFTKKELNNLYNNGSLSLFFDKKNEILEVRSSLSGWKASIYLNDLFSKAVIGYLNSEAEKKYEETIIILENKIRLLEDNKNNYGEEVKTNISLEKINQLKENIQNISLQVNDINKIKDYLKLNKDIIINRFSFERGNISRERYITIGKHIFLIIFGSFLFSIFTTFLVNYYKNKIFKKKE